MSKGNKGVQRRQSDMFLSLMIDGRNVILSIKQAYAKIIAV